jgi:tRNA G10  N-methylase Trm11
MTVLAAHDWATNADLIVDVAKLGYLDGHVLDPTYGLGAWWRKFRPTQFTASDLEVKKSPIGKSIDFRSLPYSDNTFDAAAFDPPYMAPGGRKTSTIDKFNDAYGMHDTPKSPTENQTLINSGLSEMARVVKPKGFVLVKCMDYISSGKFWNGTGHTMNHGITACDMELVDRFEHMGKPGPQPKGRRQVHARRNLSTLLVFRVRP